MSTPKKPSPNARVTKYTLDADPEEWEETKSSPNGDETVTYRVTGHDSSTYEPIVKEVARKPKTWDI